MSSRNRWRGAVAVACVLLALSASGPATADARSGTAAGAPLADAGPGRHAASTAADVPAERPCPEGTFTCVTLRVARDHFATGPGAGTVDVTFAIHRATGPRRGVWVTATGGPGSSGLAAADSYMAGMDAGIVASYDLVFFDQRGVGLSEPLACPRAAATFYLSPADARDPAQETAVTAASRGFSAACVREAGVDPAVLPYFATRQAVEDLEAFRRYLGVDALDLYGESYGTQYVQTYAIAHPDHVRSLVLDGPVDLTLPIEQTWPEAVRAMDRTLVATLSACDADPACRRDVVGGQALQAYDRTAAGLAGGPKPWRFPLANGRTTTRPFAGPHLATVALNGMYGQWGRMEIQRAVAALSRGVTAPTQRLLYSDVAVDPENLRVTPDPSWSDAAYYAIECTDYAMPPGPTAEARAHAFLEAGWRAGAGDARLGRVMFDDLPCAFWPAGPAADGRPAAIVAHPYPFLVLVADTDPITPIEGAERIATRAPGARLVVQTGGPHVLYGRGVTCVDDIVTGMLLDGSLPLPRTTCGGDLADPYLPLPPASRAKATDPLAVATATDDWIATLPAYEWWDGTGSGAAGCDLGGRFSFAGRGDVTLLSMRACALTPGLPLRASGRVAADGAVLLDIATDLGTLRYIRDAGGGRRVTGTWQGRRVDIRG